MTRQVLPSASHASLDLRSVAPSSRSPLRVLSVAACAMLTACAAALDEEEPGGPPMYNGGAQQPQGGNGNGGALNNPGSGLQPGGSMSTGSNSVGTNTSTSGTNGQGQAGMSGAPIANGAGGQPGTPNGTAGAGGQLGAASGAAGTNTGSAGAPSGNGGTGSTPPPPTGPDIDCPAGASFCSGFEGTQFPAGTQFHSVGPGTPGPFAFDSTEVFAGQQALVIPATNSGGFFYRALAVPVPGQDFWVRLYMHLSTALGDNSHDSVFGASSGGIQADVNGEALVELSEQFDRILLNTDDALFNPMVGSTLAANTWHCMEAHYNGATGDVQIFADGVQLINATGYRPLTYQSFRIGYMRYNNDRTVRYDDVIVAPNRVNCE
jgi:hypothetical protein